MVNLPGLLPPVSLTTSGLFPLALPVLLLILLLISLDNQGTSASKMFQLLRTLLTDLLLSGSAPNSDPALCLVPKTFKEVSSMTMDSPYPPPTAADPATKVSLPGTIHFTRMRFHRRTASSIVLGKEPPDAPTSPRS